MTPEGDDLFTNLISYDEPLTADTQTQQPAVTFLEPHTDLSAKLSFKNHQSELFNMNNENLKKMMSDHGHSKPDRNTYRLDIVEQPQQCRMSGYGEKDRRPIDPAPIVRLAVVDDTYKSMQDLIECPFYIIHASLWSTDMTKKYDIIEGTTPTSLRFLLGSLVSSPSLLKDLNNDKAYYFAFPDLSIRMTGQYRLQFSLLHLARNKIIQEIFSDPFTVYSAKLYPGMKETSLLSRHLAKQGLKLTVRTQVRPKKDEK
ncbi:velvet factor-domain-containing protein [Parasitella parasitica]|nr:velvet factor-domain-containing protein [Parasitella parasitica]